MEATINLPATFATRSEMGYRQEVTIDIEKRGCRWRVAKIFRWIDDRDVNCGAKQRFFASKPLTKTEATKAAILLAEVMS